MDQKKQCQYVVKKKKNDEHQCEKFGKEEVDGILYCMQHYKIIVEKNKNPEYIEKKKKDDIEVKKLSGKKEIICLTLSNSCELKNFVPIIICSPDYKHFFSDTESYPDLSFDNLNQKYLEIDGIIIGTKCITSFKEGSSVYMDDLIYDGNKEDEEKNKNQISITKRWKIGRREIFLNRDQVSDLNRIYIYSKFPEYSDHEFTHVEFQYFVCELYENLIWKNINFQKIEKKYKDGYSLAIYGKHSCENASDLYSMYLNGNFSENLIIMSLLLLERKDYPWKKYFEKYKDVYKKI